MKGWVLMANTDSNSQDITETPEEAAIKTIVESVATLADTHNFNSLEKLYADTVKMDYTSLFGGQPETKNAKVLMQEWAGVLPGFDRTRHAISNITVTVTGEIAKAKANVVANHWLADQFWQVCGIYDYELAKQESSWKITLHRFNLRKEVGSRDILSSAIKQVSKN